MAGNKTEDSPFSKFFKEDSKEFLKESVEENQISYAKEQVPIVPNTQLAEEAEIKKRWKAIRKFFIDSDGGLLPEEVVPVHISPHFYSDGSLTNYPVWISEDEIKCTPLSNLLLSNVNELYPEPGQGKILKDILPRIVLEAGALSNSNGISEFNGILNSISKTLVERMEIRGSEKEACERQISQLISNLPPKGFLVPYSSRSVFDILQSALISVSARSKKKFVTRIHNILHSLMDILDVEYENDPESTNPEHLKSSLNFADTYLDFNRLSKVIPESASEHISKERHQRIKSVIETLTKSEELFSYDSTTIIPKGLVQLESINIREILKNSEVVEVKDDKSCSEAIRQLKVKLEEFTSAIIAIRIGELEIEGKYRSEIHDEIFSSFDSNSFSEEEVSFFPPLILITNSSNLVNKELSDFTELLHYGLPINTISLRYIPEDQSDETIDAATLAVSYRNTYVAQLTSLDPQLLFEKLFEGVSAYSPSFFNVEIADAKSDNDKALLELSSSIESRNFPEYVYNGKVGTAWGSRFNVQNNPQKNQDWPVYEYKCKDTSGKDIILSIPFTYADFSSLFQLYSTEFMVIEPEFWTEDLILLSDYLLFSDKDRYGKIPFIWMIDGNDSMSKVAVSWKMVIASGEKKDFWNYLQDCGGVHSYHADKAVKDQEQKIRKEAEEEISRLKSKHESELLKVKEESAKDAMEHLTAALLDIDIESDALVSSKVKTSSTPVEELPDQKTESETEEVIAAEEEEVVEPEEELISEEPWIETPLCTNCNECVDINKRMFSYNADKQAFIADPKAGTFAQLVEAAEKCPVKIIHPGKPLNPDEPGLDDLIKRAEKFN